MQSDKEDQIELMPKTIAKENTSGWQLEVDDIKLDRIKGRGCLPTTTVLVLLKIVPWRNCYWMTGDLSREIGRAHV